MLKLQMCYQEFFFGKTVFFACSSKCEFLQEHIGLPFSRIILGLPFVILNFRELQA